jgi:hypothetical protein
MTIERELDFRLPGYFTREYWKRHGFTVEDIRWLLQCSSSIYVWHVAMLENINISNAAVKDCAASEDSIGYGGKALAIDKLHDIYCSDFPQEETGKEGEASVTRSTTRSVLYFPSQKGNITSIDLEQTNLPVPFHCMSRSQFIELHNAYQQAWKRGVESNQRWFNHPILVFDRVWKWQNIYVLPLRLVKCQPVCLYLARVVPFSFYKQWFNTKPSLSDTKDIVYFEDELWVVMEEAFYGYTQELVPMQPQYLFPPPG